MRKYDLHKNVLKLCQLFRTLQYHGSYILGSRFSTISINFVQKFVGLRCKTSSLISNLSLSLKLPIHDFLTYR